MWVLTPQMERGLRSFQNMVVQRLTGRKTRRKVKGRWEYPPLEAAMEEAGFEEIRVYINRKKNTVAQYISMRTIMDLLGQSVQRLISWVSWMWRGHEGIHMEGTKEISVADLEREEEKCGSGVTQGETPGLK